MGHIMRRLFKDQENAMIKYNCATDRAMTWGTANRRDLKTAYYFHPFAIEELKTWRQFSPQLAPTDFEDHAAKEHQGVEGLVLCGSGHMKLLSEMSEN